MKFNNKLGLAGGLLTLLLVGCASPVKPKTLIPVATYKLADQQNVMQAGFVALYDHHVSDCGSIVDENTGECWIVVDPQKVDRARKILRNALAGMSPEQQEHAFKMTGH